MLKGTDVKIDKEKCVGCLACNAYCDEVFDVDDDGKAKVIADGECENCNVDGARGVCGTGAISKA